MTEQTRLRAVEWGLIGVIADGEVMGLDAAGCIVLWSSPAGSASGTGLTPEAYGLEKLTFWERETLQRDGWRQAR